MVLISLHDAACQVIPEKDVVLFYRYSVSSNLLISKIKESCFFDTSKRIRSIVLRAIAIAMDMEHLSQNEMPMYC